VCERARRGRVIAVLTRPTFFDVSQLWRDRVEQIGLEFPFVELRQLYGITRDAMVAAEGNSIVLCHRQTCSATILSDERHARQASDACVGRRSATAGGVF